MPDFWRKYSCIIYFEGGNNETVRRPVSHPLFCIAIYVIQIETSVGVWAKANREHKRIICSLRQFPQWVCVVI